MNSNIFKKFDVIQSEDGTSLYIDFDLDSHMARVTIWTHGACDMEILDVNSEVTEVWRRDEFSNSEQFSAILTNYAHKLRALSTEESTSPEGSGLHPFELQLLDKRIGLDGVLEPLLVGAAG